MEQRKGRGSGEKDHEKRNGSRTTPTPPATPSRAGEGLPSLLAAVRCARAALMLSFLRSASSSPSPSPSPPKEGGSRRDLDGAFAAAKADPDVEAALAGVTRQMERALRVVWIEAGLQVVFVFVLCVLVFLLLEVASPPPSGYYD